MENDTGVRTIGFFHTKIPHWRLVRDNDVAFKQLVFIFNNLLHIYMRETHKTNVQRIDKDVRVRGL